CGILLLGPRDRNQPSAFNCSLPNPNGLVRCGSSHLPRQQGIKTENQTFTGPRYPLKKALPN
ncbi:hypothetical protein, partial [Microvirga vignae]|uniref:hypothetical protein n=1 Tax=Microvirga vignae TaxID=1225564 RepID=UPI001AEC46A7